MPAVFCIIECSMNAFHFVEQMVAWPRTTFRPCIVQALAMDFENLPIGNGSIKIAGKSEIVGG